MEITETVDVHRKAAQNNHFIEAEIEIVHLRIKEIKEINEHEESEHLNC